MSAFLYFAYGSNLLTARLRERCPSAAPIGRAVAPGHSVCFRKAGRDGSGKATLTLGGGAGSEAMGVLYRIDLGERPALDRAEARYDRLDDFPVRTVQSGASIAATTYIAQADACREGLLPFDWYLALIVAGAREHGFDDSYIAMLAAVETLADLEAERAGRMSALARLGRLI